MERQGAGGDIIQVLHGKGREAASKKEEGHGCMFCRHGVGQSKVYYKAWQGTAKAKGMLCATRTGIMLKLSKAAEVAGKAGRQH